MADAKAPTSPLRKAREECVVNIPVTPYVKRLQWVIQTR